MAQNTRFRNITQIAFAVATLVGAVLTAPEAGFAQERHCASGGCTVELAEGWIRGPEGPVYTQYERINGVPVMQGDILVEEIGAVARAAIATGSIQRWPGGTIPYTFGGSLGDIASVEAAIAHVNSFTGLNLVPRSGQADYIEFIADDGCWSYIGMSGGRQEVSVDDDCGFGAAVHEILHAAGVYHEQARTDRDLYVTIHLANVEAGHEHNFEMFTIGQGINNGPYDYGSIMHYSSGAFSDNGLDTITPVTPGITLGQRDGLSVGDIAGVTALYGIAPPVTGDLLQNGVPRTGLTGAVGVPRYFSMEVPPSAENLTFEIEGGTGDADLYVAFGRLPTVSDNDCAPYIPGNAETCNMPTATPGTWHVMVQAFSNFSGVTLVGRYDGGEPMTGSIELQNGVTRNGISGGASSEQRFHMEVPAAAANLAFEITGGIGDADLYVAHGRQPTPTDYDCRPYLIFNEEACSFASPAAGTWHVLVSGYEDFSGVTLLGEYETATSATMTPLSTRKLRVKSGAGEKLVLKTTDRNATPPAVGSSADPGVSGARLRIVNPITREEGTLELSASGWTRKPNGTLRYVGNGCKVTIKPAGKLTVRCGTLGGFSLDEQSQGALGVQLEFGSAGGFCAALGGTPSKDWGIGYGPSPTKGVFALSGIPRPGTCY